MLQSSKCEEIVCKEVPKHHNTSSKHLRNIEAKLKLLMDNIQNQSIESKTNKRHSEELDIFYTHLLVGTLPSPNAIKEIVTCGCDNESYGISNKLRNMEFLLAEPCETEIYYRAGHAHHAKTQELENESFLKERRQLETKSGKAEIPHHL
jgi:hypothetical protein